MKTISKILLLIILTGLILSLASCHDSHPIERDDPSIPRKGRWKVTLLHDQGYQIWITKSTPIRTGQGGYWFVTMEQDTVEIQGKAITLTKLK